MILSKYIKHGIRYMKQEFRGEVWARDNEGGIAWYLNGTLSHMKELIALGSTLRRNVLYNRWTMPFTR